MDRDGRSEAQYAAAVDLAIRGITLQDDSDYARKSDLTDFALLSDLIGLARLSDIPSLAGYALKSDLPNLTGYALKGDIPSLVGYALKTDIPSLSGYALKTDIPSLSAYAKTADLAAYVKAADLPTQFVSTTPMTVAALLADYPANAGRVGKYARVTDLYGSVDEVMRCSANSSTYYWRPQRQDFARDQAMTSGGAMTATPLLTAPALFLTGAMSVAPTINFSTLNVWPGCAFEVSGVGLTGLIGVILAGLLGGNVTLPVGGSRRVVWTGSGYRAF